MNKIIIIGIIGLLFIEVDSTKYQKLSKWFLLIFIIGCFYLLETNLK